MRLMLLSLLQLCWFTVDGVQWQEAGKAALMITDLAVATIRNTDNR